MATSVLDGEKLCEVSGNVRWSSMAQAPMSIQSGSLAVYKLSDSFYIHARTTAKRGKFLLKANKFGVVTRDSKLTLSLDTDSKASVSINLKDANPSQLRVFLDSLNGIMVYHSSLKGKLSSSSSKENKIHDIENQPCNTLNSSGSAPGVLTHKLPPRSKPVSSSPCSPQNRMTPNRPSNYFAKQMNPPSSSYNSQNKKTPFFDQTRARGKLSSSSSKENNIQDIENQPCNTLNSSGSAPAVLTHELPPRSKLVSSSPPSPRNRMTPNRPSNYFAKQMNPPSSSYNSQNKKTPFFDQTRARDNLSNTSSSGKSASSFYGRNSGNSGLFSFERKSSGTLGPGLMPPPRLSSAITFRSRDKRPFEKEVTLTGFSNLGNTCYMNAILQSLLGVPPFVQDLSNKALLDRVHPHCLYRCLYNVMICKRRSGNAEVLKNSLRKLKRTISEAATRFSGYHQHDAHEFLCQVFDQLRDDVDTCNSPSSKATSKEGSGMVADTQCPVTRSFESAVLHTVSCKQCGESALKEEIYHAFSLDIPTLLPDSSSLTTINLQTLLAKYFKDEELEYKCSKCEAKEAVISHNFIRLPRLLVLHLKRYEYDNLTEEQAKKQDKVNIERFIDLSMLCSSKTKPPLDFCPKSLLQMSPPKSKQKPQKRHYISEDDDDSNDFQPSPSVRRKLDHSFRNSSATSPFKMSSRSKTAEASSKSGQDAMGSFEPHLIDNSDSDDKENNVDSHISASNSPVWRGTEEEQMEWAIAESTKSTEKGAGSRTQQVSYTGKLASAKSLSTSDFVLDANVGGIETDAVLTETSDKDFKHDKASVDLSEDPVWARSEEEQVKWALKESAKSARKTCNTGARIQHENGNEIQPAPVDFAEGDFVFISDVSDDDLINAAPERRTGEPVGLKGGGPVTKETCLDEFVASDVDGFSMGSDDVRTNDENCCDNSGVEVSSKKPVILKNTPIRNFNKYKKRNVHYKQKTHTDCDVLNTTPTLGKFDGNLFDDVPQQPKSPYNNESPRSSNRSSWCPRSATKLTPLSSNRSSWNPSSAAKLSPFRSNSSSWYSRSAAKFRDEDMEKAINMSLQDQRVLSEEDEELNRALQLSLQEFEEKCPPEDQLASPRSVNVAETENLSYYSTIQDDESELSTHSYRLISIVSHLGTSSTSGHYISDVYDCKTKHWTSYDDSTATKVAEHGVRYKRQQSGYIFFYLYKQCVDAIENSASVKEKK